MTTKMIFICSCGAMFDIDDATGMETHINIHTSHSVKESVAHISATPTTLTEFQDSLVVQIKAKRDNDRLENVIVAEYPPASGNMFSCSTSSQDNWSKLSTLDSRGLIPYPFEVTTNDERGTYNIVDSSDLSGIIGTVSVAVLTERALAKTYIDAVLAALDEASAQAAADPYLDL